MPFQSPEGTLPDGASTFPRACSSSSPTSDPGGDGVRGGNSMSSSLMLDSWPSNRDASVISATSDSSNKVKDRSGSSTRMRLGRGEVRVCVSARARFGIWAIGGDVGGIG